MERDELGREVRRRRPPGYEEPALDEDAWPTLEHSPFSWEGRIEQLGVLSRGLSRRSRRGRHGPAVRVAGYLVVAALLIPIVVGTISIVLNTLEG